MLAPRGNIALNKLRNFGRIVVFSGVRLVLSRQSLIEQYVLKCDSVCSGMPYTSSNFSEQPAPYTLTSEHNLELEELTSLQSFRVF
jgi:hypothetical protein